MHHQLTELAAEHGPIYKLRLGSKICTVISSASVAKEVFRNHDAAMANRVTTEMSRIITFDYNDIAWSPYGQEWRHRRKIFVRELQSTANLNASYNLRKEQARNAVGEIQSKIGTPVHVFELVMRVDLNLLINLIWGSRVHGERRDGILAGLAALISEMLDLLIKPNISDFFPALARFDLQGVARDTAALVKKVESILVGAIDERMKNPHADEEEEEGRKDFMQTLVDLMQDESNQSSLGLPQIKAMLINILLGGTTTTSTTIEWAMTELLQHPKMMEKAQQELKEVVGLDTIVEESHIPKLVYLDAVLKETMRVHPVGPFLTPRKPSQNCTVAGYTIPKDSTVLVNVWSIHRDPAGWDNPLEFRPERFLDEESSSRDFKGNNFNYIPFGSGRRICAGLPLAERMIRYILASLLHSFEWRLRDGEELDMSDHLTSSLRKRIPLAAIPLPRLPSSHLYR